VLAAVFLLAGSTKLADPRGWRQALRDFGVPRFLMGPAMVLLPVVELSVAAALLPAALAWFAARAAGALLATFMLAVAFAMIRGRKPDCHCFGQLHSAPVGWQTLVRNALLGVLAGWLALRKPGDLGPGLYDWYNTLGEEASKIALVAAGAAAFVFFVLVLRSRPRPQPVVSPVEEEEEGVVELTTEQQVAAAPKPRAVPQPPRAAPAKVALGIGLPVGTPAPAFELPRMTGEKRSLESLLGQGRDVMLVFSSPGCKACESIPSSLVKWARELAQSPNIVLISKGRPEDIRPKLKDFGTAQVLLQRESEVAELYDCISTPSAVLIGADGLIRSELATGGPAIKKLLSAVANHLPTK
jgi:peroxiredoxin